jgi:hypothetical protein
MESKINKTKFVMDTDWIVKGTIDTEHKEYVLMSYFQKMNIFLEELKLYPMFIEISVQLASVQTLNTQTKLVKTKKKYLTSDDELIFQDLVSHDIPKLTEDEITELKKVVSNTIPKLFDYFNIVKALWTLVFDSLSINLKRNRKNIKSKSGFFYYIRDGVYRVWRYDTKRVPKTINQTKTKVKLIYEGDGEDLTIIQLISKFSTDYKKNGEKSFPIFEVLSTQEYPIDETLLPIAKRKILSLINQVVRYDKLEKEKKYITNGV